MLCSECDFDDSRLNCSISAPPVEGFSGCPSASGLASTLGFSSEDNILRGSSIRGFVGSSLGRGKRMKEVYEQLAEMARGDLLRVDAGGVELRPTATTPPPSRLALQGNHIECPDDQRHEYEYDDDDGLLRQETTFASLLMLPMSASVDEQDLLWDYYPTYDSPLVCMYNSFLVISKLLLVNICFRTS